MGSDVTGVTSSVNAECCGDGLGITPWDQGFSHDGSAQGCLALFLYFQLPVTPCRYPGSRLKTWVQLEVTLHDLLGALCITVDVTIL